MLARRRVEVSGRKPAAQELLLGPVVSRLGEVLDALLIAPGIVDDEVVSPFAEINVGVVQVDGVSDARPLRIGEIRIGDDFVLGRSAKNRI